MTDRVDLSDTDRLDELVARSERRVPRYPADPIPDIMYASQFPSGVFYYGNPAPAWAQRRPRLIRAWAWCRAFCWHLRGWMV